jgi:hypothetical protein
MPSSNPMGLKPGYLNWWQSLILAFACTLAGVIAAVSATSGGVTLPNGEVSSWATDLLKLSPHALMLFGLMADAITYDGVYWTSTIVGLSAMPLHPQLEMIVSGLGVVFTRLMSASSEKPSPTTTINITNSAPAAPATGGARMFGGSGFKGCTILGGDIPKEHKTAESLVVTASVISYFFLDLWLNRGVINAIGVLVLGIVLMGGQAMSITQCFKSPEEKSITAGVLYAILFGFIIGGTYYSFFQAFYPVYLPSSVIPLSNTITSLNLDTGFVYVPGVGLVSSTSPQGMQAIAKGTAMSPDEMSTALETTGTVGTGAVGAAATCS